MAGSTRRRKLTLAGIGVAGATGLLAIGLVGSGVASADPAPAPSSSASGGPGAARDAERAKQQDALADALAKELGIDKAKVAAALDKVQTQRQDQAKAARLADLKTRLDQAVTDKKLTREQADAILKAAESGVLPGGGPGGPGGFGGRGHGRGR